MGATLAPYPVLIIGFNKTQAWTHTVSSGIRHNLFELTLDADNPLSYTVDGERKTIEEKIITVEWTNKNGEKEHRQHTFYQSEFGPVIADPNNNLDWTRSTAYAVKDANKFNVDAVDTWLNISKAKDVHALKETISDSRAIHWLNTLATDKIGDVLYADIGRYPNIDTDLFEQCQSTSIKSKQEARLLVLKASHACVWSKDKEKCNRLAQKIDFGIVWINTWLMRDLRTPFGGVKNSGFGREGGKYILSFFSNIKNICINTN